jgi:homeobox-leucine zipper protein
VLIGFGQLVLDV